MEIPFIAGAYKDRSLDVNAQECENLFVVVPTPQEQAATKAYLLNTPGLVEFADIGVSKEIRGLHVMGSTLYVVCGAGFYSVNSSGTVSTIDATALSTNSTPVTMANNGTDILVADGTYGYLYQPSTGSIDEISGTHDADFPGAKYVTFLDGYFIVVKPSTGQFWLSDSYDGTSWVATNYATAEANPDNLVAAINSHQELWLYGNESTEIYYNSAATFPFERMRGVYINTGLGAIASLASVGDHLYWVNNYGEICRNQGYKPTVISPPSINHHIANYSDFTDAVGHKCIYGGHTFYQVTFPSASKTFCFDTTTGLWHTNASFPMRADGVSSRHRANCSVNFSAKTLVGDYENGKIYYLDSDTYTDDGKAIQRVIVAPAIHEEKKRIFFHDLEINFESGIGLDATKDIWNCSVTYVANDVVTYRNLWNGTHSGSSGASTLTDSNQSWGINELKGMRINNTTDGSSGLITVNTATTITATLAGGTDNDWDASDAYTISDKEGIMYKASAGGSNQEPPNSNYWTSYEGGDPQAALQWSDDGGRKWSSERLGDIGMRGDYGKRAKWRKLGSSRNRNFKLTISAPVKIAILGAFSRVSVEE